MVRGAGGQHGMQAGLSPNGWCLHCRGAQWQLWGGTGACAGWEGEALPWAGQCHVSAFLWVQG